MILIRNVKVVDGTGQPAYPADVLISGDRISAIGHFPNKKTDTVIEGLGAHLTPGFIEPHSEIDHYLTLFSDPGQKSYLEQGITTIIAGHNGASLAPLLYGSLRAIQKYTDISQINVNWHSFAEFIKTVEKLSLAVNFFSLVGHSTIRRDLTGDVLRDLTDNELEVFQKVLDQALTEGAIGLSSGLQTIHGRSVPYQELKMLLPVVAEHQGVHCSRLRNEKEDLVNAVTEIISFYQASGATTIIAQFRPLKGFAKQYELALKAVNKAGDGFYLITPAGERELIPAYSLLPQWTQSGGLKEMTRFIKHRLHSQELLLELAKPTGEEIITSVPASQQYLVGRTLADFAKSRSIKNMRQALLELMKTTELKLTLSLAGVSQPELLEDILLQKNTLIAGSPARFLELAEQRRWPLEKAIAKITALPAKALGLSERGLIKENYFADLVLLKDKKVQQTLVNGGQGGIFITR